jgi:methylmalonyl-CoA mutase cobalamin-binding subunit
MVLGQHHMVGFKVLRSFYANCGYSVQTSAECKTGRSAVLTVMSGLDPHMINKRKDEINRGLVKLDELGVVLY